MIEHLSQRLQNYAKPLEEGQVATFRLLNAGKKTQDMVDETGSPVVNSPNYKLAGRTRIRDPFDTARPRKMLEHVIGSKVVTNPDGSERYANDIAGVEFVGGIVKCTYLENHTYQYLMLHSGNSENPYRDKSKKPLFERISVEKKRKAELRNIDTKDTAIDIVRYAGMDALRSIAKGLDQRHGVNFDAPIEELKLNLRKLADTHPKEVIMAGGNPQTKVKIQMMDAEAYWVIRFDEAMRIWYDSSGKEICAIDVSKDRYDGLVEFLNADKKNREIYLAIHKELKDVEKGIKV